jgi:hypothetical protein
MMTTMRMPADLSASRVRELPRSWLPAARVSVAQEMESVLVRASPLTVACAL